MCGHDRQPVKREKLLIEFKGRCGFAQDNAPIHPVKFAVAKAGHYGFELPTHHPYSQDLILSDFFLFSKLKSPL